MGIDLSRRAMLFSLERGAKPIHESKILSNLRFEFCNRDTTLHMLLQKLVITPL